MHLALKQAERAECLRRQVGAVLVRDGKVIATGYNGAPRGLAKAEQVGCLRTRMGVRSGEHLEICRGIHAEQRAIVQAAVRGVSTRGSILYCTHHPCSICAHMIIEAEIIKVFYHADYPDPLGVEAFAESDVVVCQIKQV